MKKVIMLKETGDWIKNKDDSSYLKIIYDDFSYTIHLHKGKIILLADHQDHANGPLIYVCKDLAKVFDCSEEVETNIRKGAVFLAKKFLRICMAKDGILGTKKLEHYDSDFDFE